MKQRWEICMSVWPVGNHRKIVQHVRKDCSYCTACQERLFLLYSMTGKIVSAVQLVRKNCTACQEKLYCMSGKIVLHVRKDCSNYRKINNKTSPFYFIFWWSSDKPYWRRRFWNLRWIIRVSLSVYCRMYCRVSVPSPLYWILQTIEI